MLKKMMNRDVTPALRAIFDVISDAVVNVQLPVFLQHENAHCGELLGDRSKAKDRI